MVNIFMLKGNLGTQSKQVTLASPHTIYWKHHIYYKLSDQLVSNNHVQVKVKLYKTRFIKIQKGLSKERPKLRKKCAQKYDLSNFTFYFKTSFFHKFSTVAH